MAKFLQNFGSSQFSFWIGFAAGCLFWWLQIRFRKALPGIRARIAEMIHAMRQGLTANTEARLKNDILRYAQGLHLAAPFFSLDEILIKPRLLTPPIEFVSENLDIEEDDAKLHIPYLPDWPALATSFKEPLLSLPEALSGSANLILIGAPGSGKTTSLAYLATIVLRQNEEAGSLKDFLPLLIHVGDLTLPLGVPDDPVDTLISAISGHVSPLTLPRLKAVLQNELDQGKLLLLLDGMDEVTADLVEQVVDFVLVLIKKYPSIRVVATSSLEYFDGLSSLGFVPMALAGWDDQQKTQFIRGWGELWKNHIERPPSDGHEPVDNLLMNNWLASLLTNSNPFETTLKTWAAYAGDALGPTTSDAVEAYLVRMCGSIRKARPVLEKLALQMVIDRTPIVEARAADKWMPELSQQIVEELPEESPELADIPAPIEPSEPEETANIPEVIETDTDQAQNVVKEARTAVKVPLSLQKVLSDLVSSGLLIAFKDQRVSFIHPIIQGYLAGKAITETGDFHCLDGQADWTGGRLALRYYLAWNDQNQLIAPLVNAKSDPLYRQLFTASSFLADGLPSASWRHQVMHRLAILLQNETITPSLRARAVCALVSSADPGVSTLFRQLVISRQETIRLLAVFGIGMLRDFKAVQELVVLFGDPAPNIRRAAIYALAAIGTKPAMEAILQTLKQSSEELSKAAAEVLASFPEEGYPALKEGSADEDILVRRAVVYGLVRVNQPWAMDMLQKMQIEDGQWVVRSAATQAIEELQARNTRVPHPMLPLNETPWLISYAGKLGMGISPGKPAQNILRQALIDGDLDERVAALNYLTVIPDEGVVPQLYEIFYGSSGNLKEYAYNALWHLAATGVELPNPAQFGLG
jgi:HEAT repeat protein